MKKRLAAVLVAATMSVAGIMTAVPSATAASSAPAASDYAWFYSGTNFSGTQIGMSVWQNDDYYDLTIAAHSVINKTDYGFMGASIYNGTYCFRAGGQWSSVGAPFNDTPGNQLHLAKAVVKC